MFYQGLARLTGLVLLLSSCLLYGAEYVASQTLHPVTPSITAPTFDLQDENGKSYRLENYRGKVVVLNFWATWCPPCRFEMPSMERAHQKIKDENIVMIAINVGESDDIVFEFTNRYKLTFPLPLDLDGKVIQLYPVIGLPTTFVIDPQGRIVYRAIGGREWDDDRLLNELRKLLHP